MVPNNEILNNHNINENNNFKLNITIEKNKLFTNTNMINSTINKPCNTINNNNNDDSKIKKKYHSNNNQNNEHIASTVFKFGNSNDPVNNSIDNDIA